MNDNLDDTRATDYVLGELRGGKLAEFERRLEQSESLRAEVESIRETFSAVKQELVGESSCVNATDLSRIQSAIQSTSSTLASSNAKGSTRQWMIALVSAACVLVIGSLMLPSVQLARRVAETKSLKVDSDQNESEMFAEGMSEDATSAEAEFGGGGRVLQSNRFGVPTQTENTRDSMRKSGVASEMIRQHAKVPTPANSKSVDESGLSDPAMSRRGYRQQDMIDVRGADAGGHSAFGLPATSDHHLHESIEELDEAAMIVSADASVSSGDAYASRVHDARVKSDGSKASVDSMIFGADRAVDTKTIDRSEEYFADSDAFISGGQEFARDTRGVGVPMIKKVSELDALTDALDVDDVIGVLPEDPKIEAAIKTRNVLASSLGKDHPMVRELDREVASKVMTRDSRSNETEKTKRSPATSRGDQFARINDNPFLKADSNPLSTFSIDVDTASYSKIRMYLMQQNTLPRPDAVRIEELVNYFEYDYSPPDDEHPFAAAMDVASCPWNPKHRLARIGIKGQVIEEDRPSSNLVFLLDVSGSMNHPNKLPLVIDGMKMLADQLTENDSVAIVVYAGAAGMVLDSTRGDQRQEIHAALDRLKAGGSTNGGQGIQLAYQMARDHFIVGGTNRVILCSDGDFNVGVTGTDELVRIAQQNAKSNIFLSVLGFGTGNHNDAMMEQISNRGNGNYAFIDSKAEAHKILVDQIGGTLVTIAKDVKIQIEFNPQQVDAYRLIGYENRLLAAEDFKDDKKDAGEIGAGHTVTAMYELVPASGNLEVKTSPVDDLRYQKRTKLSKDAARGELLTLKLRYKPPTESVSKLVSFTVRDAGKGFAEADDDFQFASSVAAFGMLLRRSPYSGAATFASVLEIAESALGDDVAGYRSEFLELVEVAKVLRGE